MPQEVGSRISLGSAQFGLNYGITNSNGIIRDSELRQVLEIASDHGVKLIDTAIQYGDSETRLGEHFSSSFEVNTKLPPFPLVTFDPESWLKEQIQGSLRRLKRSTLNGLYFHNPEDIWTKNGEKILSLLSGFRDRGIISNIGASVYTTHDFLKATDYFDFNMVQIPVNFLDRSACNPEFLDFCSSNNVEIHSRSTYLQGILLCKPEERPKYFQRFSENLLEWDSWIRDMELNPVFAALAFVLKHESITYLTLGVSCLTDLQTALRLPAEMLNIEFPDISEQPLELINPTKWGQ